jgi:hypothetical protein
MSSKDSKPAFFAGATLTGRKFLGDLIEVEIERIGLLRNRVAS